MDKDNKINLSDRIYRTFGIENFAGPSDQLLDAIRITESNGDNNAVGDNGKSHGSYQIGKSYLADSNEYAKTSYTLDDMKDPDKAREVTKNYMKRYGAAYKRKTGLDPTDEVYARMHNGGPKGWTSDPEIGGKNAANRYKNTTSYWNKVAKNMKSK